MKFRCSKCGRRAVWHYMPGKDNKSNYYCEAHVSRGCSCQMVHLDEYYEGSDKYEKYKDSEGRELPCCEYEYSYQGYDIERDEDQIEFDLWW